MKERKPAQNGNSLYFSSCCLGCLLGIEGRGRGASFKTRASVTMQVRQWHTRLGTVTLVSTSPPGSNVGIRSTKFLQEFIARSNDQRRGSMLAKMLSRAVLGLFRTNAWNDGVMARYVSQMLAPLVTYVVARHGATVKRESEG